jgi:hypothetical protein
LVASKNLQIPQTVDNTRFLKICENGKKQKLAKIG